MQYSNIGGRPRNKDAGPGVSSEAENGRHSPQKKKKAIAMPQLFVSNPNG